MSAEDAQAAASLFSKPDSIASQTVAMYDALLNDIILETALNVHRDAKLGVLDEERWKSDRNTTTASTRPSNPPPTVPLVDTKFDIFGKVPVASTNEMLECQVCGRRLVASRFTAHLAKCLGHGRKAGPRKKYEG